MRTNIDIDDELMAATMRATGKATKKAAVEEAMRQVVRTQELREAINRMAGMGWDGDLDKMREEWSFEDRE